MFNRFFPERIIDQQQKVGRCSSAVFTEHLLTQRTVCECVLVSALCPSVGSLDTSSKECWVINTAETLRDQKNQRLRGEFCLLSFRGSVRLRDFRLRRHGDV